MASTKSIAKLLDDKEQTTVVITELEEINHILQDPNHPKNPVVEQMLSNIAKDRLSSQNHSASSRDIVDPKYTISQAITYLKDYQAIIRNTIDSAQVEWPGL